MGVDSLGVGVFLDDDGTVGADVEDAEWAGGGKAEF